MFGVLQLLLQSLYKLTWKSIICEMIKSVWLTSKPLTKEIDKLGFLLNHITNDKLSRQFIIRYL
jgi:hypothetical protein